MKACLGDSGVEVSIQPYKIPWGRGMGRPSMWLSERTLAYSPPARGYGGSYDRAPFYLWGTASATKKKKKKQKRREKK